MPCMHCGSEQPPAAAFCPSCGRAANMTSGQARLAGSFRWRNIALIVLVIVLLPVALVFGPAIAAAVFAIGLVLLIVVPIVLGTLAIVLFAIFMAAVAAVGAFVLALVTGVPGKSPIETDVSKAIANGVFERTLQVSDVADLVVQTGAGSIEIRTGDDATMRVTATVRINGKAMTQAEAEEKLARIIAAPPIEQDRNTIHVGAAANDDQYGNVSINYVLTVPATTRVQARTGAGSIRAVGLAGKFTAETGAGNIALLEASGAEIDARTRAGNIKLSGAKLALRAQSSAGNIDVEGAPAAGWRVQTSSGSITLRLPANAAFQLKAKTGSGSITTAHRVSTEGTIRPNNLRGTVNGGGPQLEISTGAGHIRVS